jgi:DNA-binding transcriptional MerR regulator/mannose-6-phosphate isomerase-like protein (cupin superfamily)
MMARKKRSDIESSNHDDGVQFRISEVSSLLNVSASTLRQWENVGLTAPSRTEGGYRVYSGRQVEQLKRIQSLRVKNGLNIGAIRQSLGPLEKPAAKQNAKAREVSIGRRLRQLRRTRKLTLAQAASATEVSAGFLSCLERGQVHASISTLQKLAVFYDTTVLAFFGSSTKPGKLVRPAERKRLSNEPGICIELLAHGDTAMEPHLFRLAPGTSSGESYYHDGEEFIYVIRGSCEMWLDEVEYYRLRPGDCLYFSSSQTHRWSNPFSNEAILLWVNTPPTF